MNNLNNNIYYLKVLGVLFFLSSVIACDPGRQHIQLQPNTSAGRQPVTLTPPGPGNIDPNDLIALQTMWHTLKTDVTQLNCPNGPHQRTILHCAVTLGVTEMVKVLLANKADPNVGDRFGLTPLHSAAQQGKLALIEMLLQSNAKVNIQDKAGNTPLLLAIQAGHLDVVKVLLTHTDININLANGKKQTPILAAATSEQLEILKLLLGHSKCDINAQGEDGRALIHILVRQGNLGLVQTLLENPDTRLDLKNSSGNTPLLTAIRSKSPNQLAIIECLLQKDVNLHEKDKDGNTISHLVACGDVTILECFLKQSNFNINAQNNQGRTPLHYAAAQGNKAVVECLLLQPGVNVYACNAEGRTPLHCAMGRNSNNVEFVKLLLEHEVNIHELNAQGQAFLHCSMESINRVELAELFLNYEVKIHKLSAQGQTFLHCAMESMNTLELVKLFLERGININICNAAGQTALHRAIKKHDTETATLLLKHGADVHTRDITGQTALHWAVNRNHIDIIPLLLQYGADVNQTYQQYGQTRTALKDALQWENLKAVQILLKSSDINLDGENGYVPVCDAMERRFMAAVELLLNHGANVNAVNEEGSTVLHLLVNSPQNEVGLVKKMLACGAKVNAKDSNDMTALMNLLLRAGSIEIIQILLNHPDVNINETHKGQSICHILLERNLINLLEMVLSDTKKSVDIQQTDRRGRTLLERAAAENLGNIITLLQNYNNTHEPS